ncbi:MAG: HAD-IIB family hydrolase [Firmicutes bacterium]|nr:HAD-IIB family hydrolase [Bacillota bacterium]
MKNIFFDIDGTLLPFGDYDISPAVEYTLKELINRGHNLYIATGRHYVNMPPFVLGSGYFKGYICLNGQTCFVGGKCIHAEVLSDETMDALKAFCKKHNLAVLVATENDFHLSMEHEEFEDYLKDLARYRIGDPSNEAILQATLYAPPELDDELERTIPDCIITRWNNRYMDINASHVSKSSGINFFIDYFGLDPKSIVTVGDAGNDRQMIKDAPLGIAMGNADEITKSIADIVIGRDKEDGLRDLLEIL